MATLLTKSFQLLSSTKLGYSYGNVYVRLYARYTEQDYVNNRSWVYYENRVYFDGNYIYDQQSNGTVSGTGASSVSGSKSTNYTNGETVLCTTGGWVSHGTNGKASVNASATLNFPNWGWSGTASATANLPDIPRANTVTFDTVYVGYNPTFKITKSDDSFTTTLQYKLPSDSSYTTIVDKTSSDSYNGYTFPTSLYNSIPGQYIDATLQVITYSGSTAITTETQILRINIKESDAKPSISSFTILDVNTLSALFTPVNTTMVDYVSQAQLTIKGLTTQTGATWKTVTLTNGSNSKTLNYADAGDDKSNFSLEALVYTSGSFTITITDTRTYSTTYEHISGVNFTEVPYTKPTLNLSNVVRTGPTEDTVTISSMSVNWYNGLIGRYQNDCTIGFRYAKKVSEIYSDYYVLSELDSSVPSTVTYHNVLLNAVDENISFDYQETYYIDFVIRDLLTVSYQRGILITQGIPIVNWDNDHFNVNGELTVNEEPVTQYISDRIVFQDVIVDKIVNPVKDTKYRGDLDLSPYIPNGYRLIGIMNGATYNGDRNFPQYNYFQENNMFYWQLLVEYLPAGGTTNIIFTLVLLKTSE